MYGLAVMLFNFCRCARSWCGAAVAGMMLRFGIPDVFMQAGLNMC